MAEVLNYYVSSYAADKVVLVTDDGTTLTETATVSGAINNVNQLCFDSSNNIYAVGYSAANKITVSKLDRSDLSFIQIGSQNVYSLSFGSIEPNDALFVGGKLYLAHTLNSGYNFCIFDPSSLTETRLTINSGTTSCIDMALSSDEAYLYIAIAVSGAASPRVAKFDLSTNTVVETFGSLDSTFVSTAVALMPDDSLVYMAGSATASRIAGYDDENDVATFTDTVYNANGADGLAHMTGTTALLAGDGGEGVATFNYTTGVQIATYDLTSGSNVDAKRNANGEVVVVGTAGADEDADGNYNMRVFNTSLATRKLNVGTGGNLKDVLTFSTAEGSITTQPVDSRTVRRLVAFGTDASSNGQCWYEDSAGSMAVVTGSSGDLVTTTLLTATESYEKVFVANDAKLKVADFGNIKLQTDNIAAAEANAPNKGNILTGASGATMIVDFITSSSGAAYIYGKKLNATSFAVAENVTGTNDAGNAVSFTLTAATSQVSPPHWYTWTPYGNSSTWGSMPNRATLVCRYRGRLVLSGNSQYPHQWYMSRQANPWDWLYAVNDAQAPVAGSDADAGLIGDVITCLAPNKDDYLIIGCVNSIWVMRGDPAAGGSLDQISLTTGIFGAFSYCWDAMDNFYFFGSNGICRIPSTLAGVENLSITTLPNLVNDLSISPSVHRITMGYDREREGLIICITTISTGSHTSYWYDLRAGGFFPEDYGLNPAPFSLFFYESLVPANRKLLVGGGDGYIRFFDDDEKDDDAGVLINSYAVIGPAQIGPDADQRGRLKTLSITTGTDTDGVNYDIHVADSAEEVVDDIGSGTTPLNTGTISAGNRVRMLRPRSRGAWLGVKLYNNTASETWQFEKMVADIKPAGDIK